MPKKGINAMKAMNVREAICAGEDGEEGGLDEDGPDEGEMLGATPKVQMFGDEDEFAEEQCFERYFAEVGRKGPIGSRDGIVQREDAEQEPEISGDE